VKEAVPVAVEAFGGVSLAPFKVAVNDELVAIGITLFLLLQELITITDTNINDFVIKLVFISFLLSVI
jgi:hypothetical protein